MRVSSLASPRSSRWAATLHGFSADLSSSWITDEVDDDVYESKFQVEDLFEQLQSMVMHVKPKKPLRFLHRLVEHVIQATAVDDEDSTDDIKESSQRRDPRFYENRLLHRRSEASASAPTSPVGVVASAAQEKEDGEGGATDQGRRRREEEEEEEEEEERVPPPHNLIVSVRIAKPKLLVQPTFKFRFQQFFAMDIGGSLAKLTFYEPEKPPEHIDKHSSFIKTRVTFGSSGVRDSELSLPFKGGRFHFLHFRTGRMDGALRMIRDQGLQLKSLLCTGGGAYKFADKFKEELGVMMDHRDEITCLLTGLNFLLSNVPDECYFLADMEAPLTSEKVAFPMDDVYPYLLVNVGSGVSLLRVDSAESFERIGGSPIGGGTFWGLARLLVDVDHFHEALSLCERGDRSKVDMLVGDIYGGDYDQFGLKSSTVASAFGKLVTLRDREGIEEADVAASLLALISNNIAQVAHLSAQAHNVPRIVFAGNFLRGNRLSQGALSYSINYWSGGQVKALFLKHEGYFGSLGALLLQGSEGQELSYEIKPSVSTPNVHPTKSGEGDDDEASDHCEQKKTT